MTLPGLLDDPDHCAWYSGAWPTDETWARGIQGFPHHPVVPRFRRLAEAAGPSPSGAIYFPFDGHVPVESFDVEIAEASTARSLPADVHWFAEAGRYHPANLLGVMPKPGWVMRAGESHVVRVRSPQAQSDDRGIVAEATLTPPDQTARLRLAVDHALEYRAEPASEPKYRAGPGGVAFWEGHWGAPQFRSGSGRSLLYGGRSVGRAARVERVPFGVALPPGAPPAQGWPLILSIHGGGCTYLDRLPEIVGAAAPLGLAVAGATLPYNPGRHLGSEWLGDMAYFNVFNPEAAIALFHQAVVEQMQFLRMLTGGSWPIDPRRVYCIGHSNGGTTAAMLFAVEDLLQAGVVAGFGGHVGTYVEESEVIGRVLDKLWPLLTLRPLDAEPRSRFHPLANLAHTAWGVWDTVNFAPHWRIPVFLAQGIPDEYASVRSQTAVVTAADLEVAGPPAESPGAAYASEVLAERGRVRREYPVDASSRGVAREIVSVASGHEVCFEDHGVLTQWVRAFAYHASTGRFVVDAAQR